MHFYSMTPDQIDDMTMEDYSMCVQGMKMIDASQRLSHMQASSIMDMRKSKREALIRSLEKVANPSSFEQRPMTHEDMARLLNG